MTYKPISATVTTHAAT